MKSVTVSQTHLIEVSRLTHTVMLIQEVFSVIRERIATKLCVLEVPTVWCVFVENLCLHVERKDNQTT